MTKPPVLGVIAEDPFASPQAGATLAIERVPFPALTLHDPSLDWTSFSGVVLKLLFGNTEVSRITGSGVMVAPGVALAARHVIEPELPSILDPNAGKARGFLATAITPRGLDIWRVHQVMMIEQCDVAILTLRRASAMQEAPAISQAILSTRLTPIGEAVAICGFVAEEVDFPLTQGVKGRIHISQGIVCQHFLDGRDRCMLPGPCFAVSVGTPGGLSGGPVFNESGRLVGVLSTSLGDGNDDISFVSMIHPALVRKFEWCWPPGLVKGETTLLRCDPRVCEIERSDALIETYEGFDYKPWS